jgi:hypothetical protein
MMNTKNYFLTAILAAILTAMMTTSCSKVDNPIGITTVGEEYGDDSFWYELKETLDNARGLFESARNNSDVEFWMLEELESFITRGEEMMQEHTTDEEEVRHMIEELNWICYEVEEAITRSQN